jgi:lysozyme
MRMTQHGLKLIEAFETCKTSAYICPAGVPTIGIGHTSAAGGSFTLTDNRKTTKVELGQKITVAEARRLFEHDISAFERRVVNLVSGITLQPHEFDAVVSLAYNIGVGNFSGSTLLKLLRRGDKAAAADAFRAWNKATVKGKKVVLKGLVRRREAERWMFLGDLEMAAAVADTKMGPMPQHIAEPSSKPILKSPTGNAALTTGGIGALAAMEGVRQIVDAGQYAKDTAANAGSFFVGDGSQWALIVGAGVVVMLAAAFIWFRHRRQLDEDEIVEATAGVTLHDRPVVTLGKEAD